MSTDSYSIEITLQKFVCKQLSDKEACDAFLCWQSKALDEDGASIVNVRIIRESDKKEVSWEVSNQGTIDDPWKGLKLVEVPAEAECEE
jgi:hypothetical protein